jgi:hypothetical protein
MHPFKDPSATDVLERVQKCIPAEQFISVLFLAEVPPVRSLALDEQWIRFKSIVLCDPVYDALGTIYGAPSAAPEIQYATRFASVGMFANVLEDGCTWGSFINSEENALEVATQALNSIVRCGFDTIESYCLTDPWSDWFIGDRIRDVTFLLGNGSAWWLFAFTDTE